eukprot:GFKZ01013362.1.p1 GENE.GFKZ01013362.1~~GFKZ01013362.1.p1  ORF type:complete len:151 (+),score=8.60 GFKZ01013362.1:173-625(+)
MQRESVPDLQKGGFTTRGFESFIQDVRGVLSLLLHWLIKPTPTPDVAPAIPSTTPTKNPPPPTTPAPHAALSHPPFPSPPLHTPTELTPSHPSRLITRRDAVFSTFPTPPPTKDLFTSTCASVDTSVTLTRSFANRADLGLVEAYTDSAA